MHNKLMTGLAVMLGSSAAFVVPAPNCCRHGRRVHATIFGGDNKASEASKDDLVAQLSELNASLLNVRKSQAVALDTLES